MIPTLRLKVQYRSFSGDIYDGVVTNVRRDGSIDIEVTIPGCKDGLTRHSIPFVDGPAFGDICGIMAQAPQAF